jgi:hypothetical protein
MATISNPSSSDQIDTRLLLGASRLQAFPEVDSRSSQELFGLTSCSASNVVFIAIDFESIANIQIHLSRNLDSEVGLAVLDTTDFKFDSSVPAELISTYSFALGSSGYQERAEKGSGSGSLFPSPRMICLGL